MARNGAGTYSRVSGTPYVYNTTIDQATVNSEMDDIATALTASLAKDGQTTPTANLPMGTYRHTGVGNGSARTDYAAMGQAQDGKINWVDGGGTADAITATYSPVITALVDGQFCFVRATAANATTTPTFAPNGLTARTIVKKGGFALVAGDIAADGHELILRYDLTNTRWELLNPAITPTTIGAAASGANGDITSLTALTNITAATVTVDTANDLVFIQDASDTNKVKVITAASLGDKSKIQPISASVASNALTISASALSLDFRSTALGSGTVTTVSGTPSNLVVSSGSTLGTTSAIQSRLAVLALNNAGTIELAVANMSGGVDLTETGVISTTAEGGAGAADSATVVYSTTARTNVAYRVIGYIESTQATAGTWATAPSTIQGAGGQAFTAMSSLGYGQTWQNLTASRAYNTVYTNSSGRPIQVSISVTSDTANDYALLTLGSGPVLIGSSSSSTNRPLYISAIIPNGETYKITVGLGSGTLTGNGWHELR